MRRIWFFIFVLSAGFVHGVVLDVTRLPPPAFADGEVSLDAALPGGAGGGRGFPRVPS